MRSKLGGLISMKSRSSQGTALFVVRGARVRGRSGSLLKAGRWRVPREEAATKEQTPQPVSAPGKPKQLQPRLKAGINSAPDPARRPVGGKGARPTTDQTMR